MVACVALALAGCPTVEPEPEEPPAQRSGEIRAEPELLDLGEVYVGESRSGEVTIINAGEGSLSLEVPAVGAPFALVYPLTFDPVLEPGSSTTVEVEYAPLQDESAEAALVISSGDADVDSALVDLVAEGIAPRLEIDPPSFDFGNLQIGCNNSVEVTLANAGRAPLDVYDVWYEDLAGNQELFMSNGNPGDGDPDTLDFSMNPGQATTLDVHYVPQDEEPDSGILHVHSNTPGEPEANGTTAQQFGIAHPPSSHTDGWTISANDAVDLLVVIDDSISMDDEQDGLADNLTAFFTQLDDFPYDYHLAVTTTDPAAPGALSGPVPIITPSTPDPAGTFAVNANVGTSGSSPEQGFHSAWVALEAAVAGEGDHAGFLRDDASLGLLFVSDAQEQSTSAMGWAWQDYVDAFVGYKPAATLVGLASVTGGLTGCSGAGGSATSGSDYVLASQALGGSWAIICDLLWSQDLSAWVQGFSQIPSTWPLSQLPVPATLDVEIDGLPVPTGWFYDSAINSIVFDGAHLPEEGETLTVTYDVQGDCSG